MKTIVVTIDGTNITLSLLKRGWVKGAFGSYRFWALVSNTDTEDGIEEGRVRVLELRRIEKGWTKVTNVAHFNNCWILRPKPTDFAVYEKVLRALDMVPQRPAFEM